MHQATLALEAVLQVIARRGIYQTKGNKTVITFRYKITFNDQQIIAYKSGKMRFYHHAFLKVKYR